MRAHIKNPFFVAVIQLTISWTLPLFSLAQDDSAAGQEKTYTVENQWLKAEINTEQGSYIQQLWINRKPVISTQNNNGTPNPTFHLYKEHPFQSQEELELPALRRVRLLKDIDPNIPSIHWLSETDSALSVHRTFAANATEAIIHVTTTIENIGVKTLEFFPAETVALDISSDIGKATPDLYLYMPANTGGSVKQPSGEITEENGLMYIPDYNVFISSYSQIPAHAAWRANRPWFALYNNQNRETVGFEIQIPDAAFIQPVNESLIFNSFLQKKPNDTNTESAVLLMQHVLGKTVLPPHESFTYITQYSVTNAVTPIVSVHNGIAYIQRLVVLEHPVGFYFAGAMGLPLEGKYGAIYFNENGEKIRRSHNLYGYNMDNPQRPQMLDAKFNIPTMFSTIDGGFGMTEDNQSAVRSVHQQVQRIQLVLLDPDTLEPIKVIDEAAAPWQKYE